ncbi:hypothetical protein ABZW11_33550 [Nonomuraea sp. NPDC004580]|uniref:hypothetical protein n=1 Tax=Nonomuraea sp. NPDC004580 TaxID=3154552 RepID=UPI00339F6C04
MKKPCSALSPSARRRCSGTVDIKAVLTWLRDRNWFGDVTLGDVQFGYEITSSSGGPGFRTNSFSVSAS